LHERLKSHAISRGQSFSATAAEAIMRGMAPIETESTAQMDAETGLLTFDFGHLGRSHLSRWPI